MDFEHLADYNGQAATFYEDRARVWKQSAKKYYKKVIEDEYFDKWIHAQATVDRQRDLLERVEQECSAEGTCPICGLLYFDDEANKWVHTDCELAKELADD